MSWLRDYLIYTSHQESPEVFHLWTGMAAIAATVKKNIWLDRRAHGITYFKNYPGQLQVLLVGDSGVVKKSSAVKLVQRFIPSSINVIRGGKSSAEAFIVALSNGTTKTSPSQAFLIEDEFAVFLSKATYAEALINLLLTLYDAEDFPFRTQKGGVVNILDPCLTVLGCTTPYDLGNSIPPGVTAEAFKSRMLPIYAAETDRICSLTDVNDEDINEEQVRLMKEIEKRLAEGLEKISYAAGPFVYSKEGKKWFNDWDVRWKQSPMGKKDGYPSRRPDHLLRIAMILVIAKTYGETDKLILDERSLIAADKALQDIEANFDDVFMHIGATYNKNRERILDVLRKNSAGIASTKDIIREVNRYFPDLESIKRTFSVLEQSGMIRLVSNKTSTTPEVWGLVK